MRKFNQIPQDMPQGTPMGGLYLIRYSAWAPGMDSPEAWSAWERGDRDIPESGEAPALGFTDPRFRRRLSQVSRMTIQVLYDLRLSKDTKIVFCSLRGEITQQLKINRGLIESGELGPAAFSLSVFNAPTALATIALNHQAGYTAIYPGNGRFSPGLIAAAVGVQGGAEASRGAAASVATEAALVYADELVPLEYSGLRPLDSQALAFGVILSSQSGPTAHPLDLDRSSSNQGWDNPRDFLRYLIQSGVPWSGTGCG